jgi:hypothetical protein
MTKTFMPRQYHNLRTKSQKPRKMLQRPAHQRAVPISNTFASSVMLSDAKHLWHPDKRTFASLGKSSRKRRAPPPSQ